MTVGGGPSMGSRGDTLSTSWTPIDRVSPSSKYQPGVTRVSPPGMEQVSYGSASSSSQGTQARLVAHGQVGTLRAGETYTPPLADWSNGLIDFSPHPSESKFQWSLVFNEVPIRIETEPSSAPRSTFSSKTPACSSLLQGLPG